MTLEYAYQDWALAQFADVLGNQSDAELFHQRSENWRNVFDIENRLYAPLKIQPASGDKNLIPSK